MDTLINYLIDYADEYDLDIIDDSENHNMIFVGFKNPAIIHCKNVEYWNVKELKFNTEIYDYVVCAEDDFEIGYIVNEESINTILDNKKLIYGGM